MSISRAKGLKQIFALLLYSFLFRLFSFTVMLYLFVCLDCHVLARLMSQQDVTAVLYQESFTSYAEVSLVTALNVLNR